MHLQRAWVAGIQVERRLLNGPLRAQSKTMKLSSILRRMGIRKLPGICLYSAKCVVRCKARWYRGLNLSLVLDVILHHGRVFFAHLREMEDCYEL